MSREQLVPLQLQWSLVIYVLHMKRRGWGSRTCAGAGKKTHVARAQEQRGRGDPLSSRLHGLSHTALALHLPVDQEIGRRCTESIQPPRPIQHTAGGWTASEADTH